MNERITQLAVNAGLYVDLYGKPWPKSMSAEECEAAYKKFAELIVLETLTQVNQNMELTWIDGEAKIKQHFGVEE